MTGVGAPSTPPPPPRRGPVPAATIAGYARIVLEQPGALPTASWARAVAVLGRQALERAIDERWDAHEPQMRRVRNQTARLVALRHVPWFDAELAGRAAYTWSALSEACHHHVYDYPPTAGELDRWLGVVDEVLAAS